MHEGEGGKSAKQTGEGERVCMQWGRRSVWKGGRGCTCKFTGQGLAEGFGTIGHTAEAFKGRRVWTSCGRGKKDSWYW